MQTSRFARFAAVTIIWQKIVKLKLYNKNVPKTKKKILKNLDISSKDSNHQASQQCKNIFKPLTDLITNPITNLMQMLSNKLDKLDNYPDKHPNPYTKIPLLNSPQTMNNPFLIL